MLTAVSSEVIAAGEPPRTPLIEFNTQRLRLRQWRAGDIKPFIAMSGNPKVMEFLPDVMPPGDSRAVARRIRSLIAERGWGLWAVEEIGGAPFIGFVGLHVPSAELPFAPCVEIGWRLAPPFWGRGYATEAAFGALKAGLNALVSTKSYRSPHGSTVAPKRSCSDWACSASRARFAFPAYRPTTR